MSPNAKSPADDPRRISVIPLHALCDLIAFRALRASAGRLFAVVVRADAADAEAHRSAAHFVTPAIASLLDVRP
jgi:hypothetical protein